MKFFTFRLHFDYPQASDDLVHIVEVSIVRRKQSCALVPGYVLEHFDRTFGVLPGKIRRDQHVAPAAGLLTVHDSDIVAV